MKVGNKETFKNLACVLKRYSAEKPRHYCHKSVFLGKTSVQVNQITVHISPATLLSGVHWHRDIYKTPGKISKWTKEGFPKLRKL